MNRRAVAVLLAGLRPTVGLDAVGGPQGRGPVHLPSPLTSAKNSAMGRIRGSGGREFAPGTGLAAPQRAEVGGGSLSSVTPGVRSGLLSPRSDFGHTVPGFGITPTGPEAA